MARPPTTARQPGHETDRLRTAVGPDRAVTRAAGAPARPAAASAALAERRIDGLTDLWLTELPDGGVAAAHDPGTRLSADSLTQLVRAAGGDADVRIMLPHGARHLSLFRALAGRVGRDVLITPADAELSHRTPGDSGGPTDTVPVDQATGLATDWLVVHPPGPGRPLPGWFDLSGGLVRPRAGLVTLALPGGVALVTRADFVARRSAVARLMAGHAGLTTIAVAVRDGGFLIGTYSGTQSIYSGHRVAEALGDLPTWGGDIRTWLTWPADPALQRRLRSNLVELADTMGTTVWAPPPGGSAELGDASADLSAVDRDGHVARWQPHAPSGDTARAQFESDADGRLVPVGGPLAGSYPGVALVSVSRQREAAMADRYARLDSRAGLFAVDLAVLPDGRLATVRADDTLLALGPNECRMLLAAAGWWDEDLLLLCPADPGDLHHYAAALFAGLGVDVWVLPPGAVVDVRAGQPVAIGPDRAPVEWQRLATPGDSPRPPRWRSQGGRLVRPIAAGAAREARRAHPERDRDEATAAGAASASSAARPSSGDRYRRTVRRPTMDALTGEASEPASATAARNQPVPAARTSPGSAAPAPSLPVLPRPDQPVPAPPAAPGSAAPAPSLPVLPRPGTAAGRRERPRGIAWLPSRPAVNTEPFELYIHTDVTPAQAAEDGVPSPDLFLLGELAPPAPRLDAPPGHLLRVRVAPGAAVDLTATDQHVPPTLYLSFAGRDVFLLPAGRLDRVRMLAGYALEPSGEPIRLDVPATGAVRLRCVGARHGVDGLPGDVPRWPAKHTAKAYALLPPTGWADSGGLGLYRRRPPARHGHRLVELRVEPHDAIDLRACARELASLALVRPTAAELRAARFDLILPARYFDRTTVTQVLAVRRRRWRPITPRENHTLSELLDPQEPAGQRS
ncbi:hypothetical protein [Dactylosporangium sp. CA-233914]|uniref:hypothetical protein n=1 Tax=Dactylosporangium sp. CA-233914 TaxID=3239934 RepID=UPI003D92941E